MALKNEKFFSVIILLVVLVIASFFRLWKLDSFPPGLYPDVAIYGNDGLETLRTGNFRVFYPENNGREGLFMWLLAFSFSIFGVSIWSIKIVTVTIGILTVLGLYLLTQELFSQNTKYQSQATNIALLSSFFLAVSFWHVNFSRIGFRAILLPFILVFGFYFLFRGFRQKRILYLIISGIFFGLGFYTYISYRFIVLLLPLVLICWWFIYQKEEQIKKFLLFTFYFLFFAFIIALPIGIYFYQNPQYFVSRAAGISIFTADQPAIAFFKSLIFHLAMFNFYGDPNWRHNFSGSPMLFWPVGILFLIGLFISIKEVITKKLLTIGHWSLVIWFFVMLLPGILTYEGIPHALRVIGVIPVVYIFSGLGGWWVYERLKEVVKYKKLFLVSCFLFLAFVAFTEFNKYFFSWAKNPNVQGAFTKKFADIGYYLNSLPENYQKYVIVNEPGVPVPWPNGLPMPAQTIMFIESTKFGSLQSTYLLPDNLDQIKMPTVPAQEKKTVILPMKYEEDLFNKLFQNFPEEEIKEIDGIWIYEIR